MNLLVYWWLRKWFEVRGQGCVSRNCPVSGLKFLKVQDTELVHRLLHLPYVIWREARLDCA